MQQITELRARILSNPKDASLEASLKNTKLAVFKNYAINPQSSDAQLAVRNFCELDVLYTLGAERLGDYELAAQRLNSIYFNTLSTLGYSDEYYNLQGVYLLYLLSFNKIGQFYSEIELLPRNALDQPAIKFVINIEQALSIGNYSAVVQQTPPTGLGTIFLARIVETIRDQTAMSAGVAYQRIRIADALQIFHMNNINDLKQYAASHHYSWQFDDQYLHLDQLKNIDNPLNSDALINNSLQYVHELDKII